MNESPVSTLLAFKGTVAYGETSDVTSNGDSVRGCAAGLRRGVVWHVDGYPNEMHPNEEDGR